MDSAWCPVCDKQIEPKRITTTVPRTTQPTPPAPPSSPRRKGAPRKAGLVNGTGRIRPNGTIKPPPVAMKQRIIIDQGPTELYCSDECRMVDLANNRYSVPHDPASEDTIPSPITMDKMNFGRRESDTESEDASPKRELTSMEKFAIMYNFPELPPIPVFEPEQPQQYIANEYNSGIMMAGRLINSLCPPPAKQQTGRYRPFQEPRKPIPGWNDGSHAWRSTVYSLAAPSSNVSMQKDASTKAYGSFVTPHRSPRMSRASSSATLPASYAKNAAAASASAAEALLSSFSESFTKRSETRAALYSNRGTSSRATSPVTSSAASTHSLPSSLPKTRSLVPDSVKGKLLVPDVKMRVHSGSSASLSSNWSGPASSSTHSRRSTSVRSPLSLTSDSDEETSTSRCESNLSRRHTKRPTVENNRSWSYDNVQTYDIMPMLAKKVKKIERRIVDGEERLVEVEVEEYPERKRLFLFPAPQRISVP